MRAINEAFSRSDDFIDKLGKSLIVGIGNDNSDKIESINKELDDLQNIIVRMSDRDPNYDNTAKRIMELRDIRQNLLEQDASRQIDYKRVEDLMETVRNLPAELTEYDDTIVRKLVETVVVTDAGFDITLKNGACKTIII